MNTCNPSSMVKTHGLPHSFLDIICSCLQTVPQFFECLLLYPTLTFTYERQSYSMNSPHEAFPGFRVKNKSFSFDFTLFSAVSMNLIYHIYTRYQSRSQSHLGCNFLSILGPCFPWFDTLISRLLRSTHKYNFTNRFIKYLWTLHGLFVLQIYDLRVMTTYSCDESKSHNGRLTSREKKNMGAQINIHCALCCMFPVLL